MENEQDINGLNITSVGHPDHPCFGTVLVEAKKCSKHRNTDKCDDEDICSQLPMRGFCGKKGEIRFYFSKSTNDCGMYMNTGCVGSRNDFDNYTSCREACNRKS
jgi:hypothetical protein